MRLHARYTLAALIGVTTILVLPISGAAQTLFTWPDSRIDVGQYASIESCLAAADRVRDSLHARSDTLFDTLPPRAAEGLRPVPTEIQTTVQRCLHRFPVASIPLDKWRLAQQLYLLAGNDAGASAIVTRRLDTIPPTDSGQRVDVLNSAIVTYLGTPARLDSAQRLVEALTQFTHADVWKSQVLVYQHMMLTSMRCDRPEMGQRWAHAITSLAEVMVDSVKDKEEAGIIGLAVHRANVVLYHDMLMDSLRKSDGAYANVKRQKFRGMGATGSQFPELRGDFVFPASAKDERFPRPGKLTLVVGSRGDRQSFVFNHRIRRLKQQFPALDIVIVTATKGVLAPLAPPSPAEEAAHFEKMMLKDGELPATLIVYTRPFFSLPDPDRRKIGLPTEFDKKWPKFEETVVLVDATGAVVELGRLGGSGEKRFLEILQIVYDRELKHSQANAH